MRIEVTQEDINEGRTGSASQCAIARALWKTKCFTMVSVSGREVLVKEPRILVKEPAISKSYTPGQEIRDWIMAFDGHQAVKPFAFDLPEAPIFGVLKPIKEEALIPAMIPARVKETADVR